VKVLVTGSRHWDDASVIEEALLEAWKADPAGEFHLVHGAASGADTIAHDVVQAWSREVQRKPSITPHPADWDANGRAAGPIRNRAMLRAHPDTALVLAFTDDPPCARGSGTWDMVSVALLAGVPVRVFSHQRKRP
jgi:hypothetical protein